MISISYWWSLGSDKMFGPKFGSFRPIFGPKRCPIWPKRVKIDFFSKYRVMTPRWKGFGMEITNFEKIFEIFHIGPIFGPKRCPIWPKMGKIDIFQSVGS